MVKKKASSHRGTAQTEGSEQIPADLYPEPTRSDVSCMEFASTPSPDRPDQVDSGSENSTQDDDGDIADMCADLASTPLYDVTDECDEATECSDALNAWAEATESAQKLQNAPQSNSQQSNSQQNNSQPSFVDSDSDDQIETVEYTEEVAETESTASEGETGADVFNASSEAAAMTSQDSALAPISINNQLSVSSTSNKLVAESFSEAKTNQGRVPDLVAQQLRQMFEDGDATATCASAGSFTGTHSMNLQVKAGSVDMNLSTVTEANQEVIELKAQIELQQKLLEDAQARLDAANQRIGFLEAFVAQKDQLLEEKKEQSNWLKSLFGM